MTKIIWLVISYLIGSIPSGFLISSFYGKNILEVGWRKTSGSNVFKNVGKGAGILTGVLDLVKGFLAVYIARKLNLPEEFQVLSGVLVIVGNNWSLFLKFAGGRGIATYIGAFLALTPRFLFLSILPFLVLSLIWQASIATILFILTVIFLSFYFNQPEAVGIFASLSLIPIFLKRLSPFKELSLNKKGIILNRLIFDDDVPHLNWKIKKLIGKLTKK